jgi:hypothetical protein
MFDVHVPPAYLVQRNGVLCITIQSLIAALGHAMQHPNATPVEDMYRVLVVQHHLQAGIAVATTQVPLFADLGHNPAHRYCYLGSPASIPVEPSVPLMLGRILLLFMK